MLWIDVGAVVGFMIVDAEVTNRHDVCTLFSQLAYAADSICSSFATGE